MTNNAPRIVAEVEAWSDEYLLRQLEIGEAGFASHEVWAALQAEAARRKALGVDMALPGSAVGAAEPKRQRLFGVRGWLALFVLGCFLSPFFTAGLVVGGVREVSGWRELANLAPAGTWAIALSAGGLLGLTCVRVLVGIRLVRRHPSGALLAAALLVAGCIYIVASAVLLDVMLGEVIGAVATRSGAIPDQLQRLEPALLLRLSVALAAEVAWLMYFFRSERVRATYGPVTWQRIGRVLMGRPLG